jgi:predicted alpha-1,2-mannosidase
MQKPLIIITAVLALVLHGCAFAQKTGKTSNVVPPNAQEVEYANPLVGTGGHGHTYPGPTVPFGMVQLSPDTRLDGWDGCGGYHYSDSIVYGFSHTHLQGTGVSDYGDVLFMPTNGKTTPAPKWRDSYKSEFNHNTEIATPGYYKVKLDKYNIDVELTATERVGIHHYTLQPKDTCRLFIDMMHRDELLYYDIQTIGDTVVYGYRVSKAWAENQHAYFYAVFSKPFLGIDQLMQREDIVNENGERTISYEEIQVFSLLFAPSDVNDLTVKVGWSGTDAYGAQHNLWAEAPHWNFEKYKNAAKQTWQNELSKFPIQSNDPKHLKNYYSALYHCYTTPNIWSDVDGRYRGMDGQIHEDSTHVQYTIFSLWDTFRALHPLFTITQRDRVGDMIQSFLNMHEQGGKLPVWELAANETNCMIGYHSVSVITDAYMSGIRNFDTSKALEAMVAAASSTEEARAFHEKGYVPAEHFSESVSKTLEYAYDDWCIAQMAKELGSTTIHDKFIEHAQNWKNIFDPETKFFRPRRNGGFPTPFDPYQVNFNFTEANAWQYRLFVPQDIETLIAYHGGKTAFMSSLDDMFKASTQTSGREQADITGLIGQYAHGNEPSHHMAMLYNYVNDDPKKTNDLVKRIMQEMYAPTPDGLCGNEDCGQMSAWYVLASHDLYKVTPGQSQWLTWNKNNTLPNKHSVSKTHAPSSKITERPIVALPIITGPQTSFTDQAIIKVSHLDPQAELFVTFTASNGDEINITTGNQFVITSSGIVRAWAMKNDIQSQIAEATFTQRNSDLKIKLNAKYDAQYTGGSDDALIDGVRGGKDFRTGAWQGFQGQKVEAIVDLGSSKQVSYVALSALRETKSWIWYPTTTTFYISEDGVTFTPIGTFTETELNTEIVETKEIGGAVNTKGRYIKVVAESFDTIPSWHIGVGGKPWIFVDEILIEEK